jgi:hypothetical protein
MMSTTKTPRKKPPTAALTHEFVEFVPNELSPSTLYISIPFATATHLCVCGCGSRVVTPIHPTGWQLLFDGETVSLRPSIGNWGFRCRSHYWIRNDRVVWAPSMTQEEIERGRQRDRQLVDDYFGESTTTNVPATSKRRKRRSLFDRLLPSRR